MHITKNISQMMVMIFVSVVFGLGSNFIAEKPLPLFKALAKPVPVAGAVSFTEADADFVKQLSVDPGTVLIDARLVELFDRGHIPGAVSLPLSRFDDAFAALLGQLQTASLLVVYCSGPNCHDSYELALRLREKGFNDLLLYRGGMEDWLEKGNVVAR
jgi:rhodanese-related sulfurtransferase